MSEGGWRTTASLEGQRGRDVSAKPGDSPDP